MLILSTALNCIWLLEQPEGSKDVFMRHPRLDLFSNCISWVTCQRLVICLWYPLPTLGLPIFKLAILILPAFLASGMEDELLDDALRIGICKKNGGVVKLPGFGAWPGVSLSCSPFYLELLVWENQYFSTGRNMLLRIREFCQLRLANRKQPFRQHVNLAVWDGFQTVFHP